MRDMSGLIQLHANASLAKSAQRTNKASFTRKFLLFEAAGIGINSAGIGVRVSEATILAMSRIDSIPDVVVTKFAIQMGPLVHDSSLPISILHAEVSAA
jgi:hypothetical protein